MAIARAAAVSAGQKNKTRRHHYARVDINKRKSEREANIGCKGNRKHDKVAKWVRDNIRDKKWFQTSIICVIFIAGILVGVQTYDIKDAEAVSIIETLDTIVLAIFIFEIVVKLIAEGNHPLHFFKDAWNNFDFGIVVASLLPFGGSAITALRLVRLLRVLKLVRALPKLRILVMGLLKSMSSIAYIGLLLMLLFYLYAVLGVILFSANDPVHMGSLHITFLTLFRCATLEDWTDVMYIAIEGCENYGYDGMEDLCKDSQQQGIIAAVYFCSFVILSSMMILNLFIGVITSSMQDAKSDLTAEMESEAAAGQAAEEHQMRMCIAELGDLLHSISEEVDDFVALEKERNFNSVVQLSNKNILNNVEVDVRTGKKQRKGDRAYEVPLAVREKFGEGAAPMDDNERRRRSLAIDRARRRSSLTGTNVAKRRRSSVGRRSSVTGGVGSP